MVIPVCCGVRKFVPRPSTCTVVCGVVAGPVICCGVVVGWSVPSVREIRYVLFAIITQL